MSSLVLVVLATAAFGQQTASANFGEITVERVSVVDRNGTLRMVIAGKDRMHPGVMDGITQPAIRGSNFWTRLGT